MKEVIVRKPTEQERKKMEQCEIWSHEAGTFDWAYKDKQETCLLIEGKASVRGKDGIRYAFQAGDLVIFPTNWNCVWEITEDVRKFFIFDMEW